MTALKNIAIQIRGISYGKTDAIEKDEVGYIPILRAGNIQDGFIIEDDYVFVPEKLIKESQKLKKGDILIAASSGSKSIVGKASMILKDMNASFGAFCKVIRPDFKKVDENYLKFYFQSDTYRNKISNLSEGANINNLKTEHFDNLQIPLPPLPEQKRIAALLDAADSLRQKDKALLAKYDELSKSLFLEMFGDPVRNEKGWEKVPTIKYSTCVVPGRDKPKSFTGKTPWITTSDLIHLGATFDSKMNIGLSSDEIREVKSKVIPVDSVIMTCVGELGIVSTNKSEIVVNQQLHAFICGKELNNVFLMYNLSFQKPYMIKMASSTTVPYMNKTIANNTPTIVPPIELQIQFAERVKIIETQKRQVELSLAKSEEIFRGVMGEVFG